MIIYPTTNYIVFDFETTGLPDPVKGVQGLHVIQMSALKVKSDGTRQQFDRFVKVPVPVPQIVQDVTKITDEILAEQGIDEEQAWSEFWAFLENRLPLIGHNSISFDRLFLEAFYARYKFDIPGKAYHIDTGALFKAHMLKRPEYRAQHKLAYAQKYHEDHFRWAQRIMDIRAYGLKWNLVQACKDLGIDTTQFQAHRSDQDCAMTELIYQKLALQQ